MNLSRDSLGAVFSFGLCFGLCVLLALASGCANDPGAGYQHGAAYRKMFAAQVVHRDAPQDPAPVDGMAGLVSEGIFFKRYLKEIVEEEDDEENER